MPNAPKPLHQTFTFPANILSETDQNFDFRVDVDGKTKTIDLPDGGQIITAPGQHATLTNLTDNTSVTLNITGTTHATALEDGSTLYEVNGRNLLFDPSIGPNDTRGFVLAIGHFSYIFGPADDSGQQDLVQPLEGQGQVVNVFDLLV